ncbi:MAG: uroporphyrinogen decarboxylase family protein [Phycisphaerae bacterium]
MTSRQRMITALRNKQPDRIPVAPDISNMIPSRLTGKPFWDVYFNENPPLWQAYINAVRHFGIDGWFIYGDIQYKSKHTVETENIIEKQFDRWIARKIHHTPEGDLTSTSVCMKGDPPTTTEKMIKNFRDDFHKFKYIFAEAISYDPCKFNEQKEMLGELGIMGVCICTPGLHIFSEFFEGSVEAATYAMIDYPDLFEELVAIYDKLCLQLVDMAIDAGTDSILTGGSGSITLQSPQLWRQFSLPTLKKITKRCKEAGVISGVHSCGRERYLVEVCANETDLDYINPLEIPPMGDCDLAECKHLFGKKLALMGNLQTTDVMLRGSANDVKRESLKAILAAGEHGGFVLSTGDQCGRDTPDENLFIMVKTVQEFGQYPLNHHRIVDEICSLQ